MGCHAAGLSPARLYSQAKTLPEYASGGLVKRHERIDNSHDFPGRIYGEIFPSIGKFIIQFQNFRPDVDCYNRAVTITRVRSGIGS